MKTINQIIAILVGNKVRKILSASALLAASVIQTFAQGGNKSLSFNGNNSRVQFAINDVGLNYDNNVGVSAWVNWSNKANAGPNAVIMQISDTTGNSGQFWLQHNSTNTCFQFVFETDSLTKTVVNSTTNPVPGNWYYVSGSYDGHNINIHVNGILEASALVQSGQNMNAYNSSFKITLGSNNGLNQGFNGLLDEISVWNQALLSNQVQDIMCHKLSPSQKGLITYWNIDSLNYDTIYDVQGGGINGTLYNTSIVSGGAPIGDSSSQITGDSSFTFINTNTGDSLVIDSMNFISNSVYIYQVEGLPSDSLLPSGVTTSCSNYYYGIFIPNNTNGTYRVTYYYASTSCVGHKSQSSSSGILLTRNAQNSYNWQISNAQNNIANTAFVVNTSGGRNEFLVGKINYTTGIKVNTDVNINKAYPNPFSSNVNLTITCAQNITAFVRLESVDGNLITEIKQACYEGENHLFLENLDQLVGGIYFLRISAGNNYTSTLKLIKD